jgi:hypothetical protein
MASNNCQVGENLISTAKRGEREESEGGEMKRGLRTHLVLVNNPTLSLLVISIVAIALFGNVVYGHVLQAGFLGDLFTVNCLAHAWGAGDYDVGSSPHCDWAMYSNASINSDRSYIEVFGSCGLGG